MLFHVFAHVDADQISFIVEKTFRKRLGKFRLSHARRPDEDETAERTVCVVESCPRATNGARHGFYRLALPDNAAAELLRQLDGGDPRLRGDDLSHVVLMEFQIGLYADLILPVAHFFEFCGNFCARFFLLGERRRVAVAESLVLEHDCASEFFFLLPHRFGQIVAVQPQAGSRLVDEIDGFIGQKSVRNITVGKRDRRLDGVVADRDLVVRLVAIAQPF